MAQVTKRDTHTRRKAAVALACAVVLCVGAVLSALTSYDTATNRFSLAQGLDIRVVEQGWDSHPDTDGDGVPDHAEGILPTQTVEKDPAIENLTGVQAYVFAEVSVPVRNVATANADGTLNAAADTELFSFSANEGWTLMATVPGDGEVTYRYAYDSPIGRGTTPTLFDSVTYANVAGGALSGSELVQLVVVNAKGVQATGFADADEAYAELYGDPESTFVTDVTVNDPAIDAGQSYEIVRVEPMSVASTATTEIDSQVTFSDVELAEDASYAVIAEGGDVADPIVEFVADEDVRTQAEAGGVTIGEDIRTTFAIYSADDNSLSLYKRTQVPTAGDIYEGKTVTNVYNSIDSSVTGGPWSSHKSDISTVEAVDNGIQPNKISYWFTGCTKLESANLGKLDTSKVKSLASTFSGCTSLRTVDLSGWNTSDVTSMQMTFNNCINLYDIQGIESLDTSNVTTVQYMFNSCNSLSSLDLSNWSTSCVSDFGRMFQDCKNLSTLNLSNWTLTNTTYTSDFSYMFNSCSINSLDLDGWDISTFDKIDGLFSNATSIVNLSVRNWNTSGLKTLYRAFFSCESLKNISGLETWNVASVTNMEQVFYGCNQLESIDLSSWDTSKVVSIGQIFRNCSNLKTVYVGPLWSIENAADTGYNCFAGCYSLVGQSGFSYDPSKLDAIYATTDYYLTLKEATTDASVFSINKMVKDAIMQVLAA